MRLAELVGTFSIATDAGMGMPMERALRAAAVAVRLAELCGAAEACAADAYYLALTRYLGCTADADVAAHVMGDEVALRGALYGADWGAPAQLVPRMLRARSQGRGALGGTLAGLQMLMRMPRLFETVLSHCEVGDRLAHGMGFGAAFRGALLHSFERWDGRGWPHRLKGESIALSARFAQAAEEIEFGHRSAQLAGACALVKQRAGGSVDPELAECFQRHAARICEVLEVDSAWSTALAAEPGTPREAGEPQIDAVLSAMADFADLKSRFTRTHTRGVAELAEKTARQLGVTLSEQRRLGRAALVHDLGRVAVSAAVWDKPGALSDPEREQVRLHTYLGERILSRAPGLAQIAELAMLAHERVDGTGYHRRLGAAACSLPARILAAADVYCALTEARAHRPAYGVDQACQLLGDMQRAGGLCPEALSGLLAAVGGPRPARAELPAGLTERELAVLRLVARGLTNKEIASELGIATKTAGHHVQHIFEKVGVTTRAAATLFAMQKGLLSS